MTIGIHAKEFSRLTVPDGQIAKSTEVSSSIYSGKSKTVLPEALNITNFAFSFFL
jgi:hypothetical protein